MDRSIPMLLIGLIFGCGIGFTVAAGNGITLDGHDHADPGHHGHGSASAPHEHAAPYVLPAGETAPTVSLDVRPDPSSGWNLHIVTTGFRFAPERASGPNVPGEGHAHVYVNGDKIGRVYGPWMHLGTLPDGEVTIAVTLNANDHRPLVVGDRPVSASVIVRN